MFHFLFSYLASVALIAFFSFENLQAVSLDALVRIGFYMGLPAAMLLSMVLIVLGYLLGIPARKLQPSSGHPRKAAYAG